jgi:hypothetical protein
MLIAAGAEAKTNNFPAKSSKSKEEKSKKEKKNENAIAKKKITVTIKGPEKKFKVTVELGWKAEDILVLLRKKFANTQDYKLFLETTALEDDQPLYNYPKLADIKELHYKGT